MINVCVQDVSTDKVSTPSETLFNNWANAANINLQKQVELTIRIVDKMESAELNGKYRNKKSATNVLAFPFEVEQNIELVILGDLVICSEIVQAEAQQQLKTELEHWAHMVVHGVLHLQGYDHIKSTQAEEMEQLEVQVLNTLGFGNPYLDNEL